MFVLDNDQVDQLVFKELVDVRFPMLSAHLEGHGVNVSSVSTNWFLCIFVNSLPLESCLRVWDIFFLERCSSVLFRVALALVDIYFKVLHPCTLSRTFHQHLQIPGPLAPMLCIVCCCAGCWVLLVPFAYQGALSVTPSMVCSSVRTPAQVRGGTHVCSNSSTTGRTDTRNVVK